MTDDVGIDNTDIDNAEHYAKIAGGLFDIRNVIAALLACYGVILTVTGIVHRSAAVIAKAGVNINLWAGVGLLAVAAIFVAWAAWRPVRARPDEPR
jgi:hypothetical protein